MKLPSDHVTKAFELAIIRVSKFEKHIREALNTCFLSFTVHVEHQFIKYAADSLVGIIRFKSAHHAARKAFGNDWRRIVKLTVYCDALMALNILEKVLNTDFFLEDVCKIYGSNFVMLAGSYRWMSIFCSSRTGTQVPNTGIVTAYTFNMRDADKLRIGISQLVGDKTFKDWEERKFIISENYDRLNKLKQILPELGVYKPDFKTGLMERPCLGDLLITDKKDTYNLLDSDGVTPLTLAYNLVFRTRLTNLNVGQIDLTKHIFITWEGQADLFVRASQIEIWFDIPYNVSTGSSQTREHGKNQPPDQDHQTYEPVQFYDDEFTSSDLNLNGIKVYDNQQQNIQNTQPQSTSGYTSIKNIAKDEVSQHTPTNESSVEVIKAEPVSNGIMATVKTGANIIKSILIPGAILLGSNVIAESINKPRETENQNFGASLSFGPAKIEAGFNKTQNRPIHNQSNKQSNNKDSYRNLKQNNNNPSNVNNKGGNKNRK